MNDIISIIAMALITLCCLFVLALAAIFMTVTAPVAWLGEACVWIGLCLGIADEVRNLRESLDSFYASRERLNEACVGLAHNIAYPFNED
jgi:hypothetical protein